MSSFEGWTEALVFSTIFVIIFGVIIVGGLNTQHGGSYEIEGLETDGIQETFENYQESQKEKMEQGETGTNSFTGLTLTTSWDILNSILSMILVFIVSGGWVTTLVSYMQLPDIVGWAFRGLYIVALGFIILRALLNRNKV